MRQVFLVRSSATNGRGGRRSRPAPPRRARCRRSRALPRAHASAPRRRARRSSRRGRSWPSSRCSWPAPDAIARRLAPTASQAAPSVSTTSGSSGVGRGVRRPASAGRCSRPRRRRPRRRPRRAATRTAPSSPGFRRARRPAGCAREGTILAAPGSIDISPTVAAKCSGPAARPRASILISVTIRCGGDERVGARRHRRRAGVIGAALDHDLEAGDAGDGRDHADVDPLRLQHRALLPMCSSRNARMSSRRARSRRAASPPTMAIPSGSVRPSGRGARARRRARAPPCPATPTQETPNTVTSSPRQSTTSRSWSSVTPRSASARATSSPAATPAMPSKRPPEGTVSEWEPTIDRAEPGPSRRRAGRSGCRRRRSAASRPASRMRASRKARPLEEHRAVKDPARPPAGPAR